MTLRISVVMPVLNEAARIGQRLDELARLRGIHEVCVSDGGSDDDTCRIVQQHGAALLVASERGRAHQMNTGARAATGDVLVFLHADVSLPHDAALWIRATLDQPRVVAGAFRTWHVNDSGSERAPFWLHLADLRSRCSTLPYGDQALFLRTETFFQLGGFPEQPLMEDFELSRRLRRCGKISTTRASVRVSGRRFLAHPIRYALLINSFPLLYRLGFPPEQLRKLYHDIR